MIKLFRQVRYNFMVKGHVLRYFKYAIGEIFLVVIGILLALSINNWNIERLERKTEQAILKDLQVEFRENLSDAERVYQGNEGIYQAVSHLQDNIENNALSNHEMDSLLYFVFDWFDYTPKPGASNNLINSGNLNLISNKELRKLLTLWSGVVDELDDDEQLAVHYSQNVIIPFLASNYPISNLEKFDYTLAYYNRINADHQNEIKNVNYDAAALLKNEVFQSHLSVKKMYARHNAMEGVAVIEHCKSILELVESEIED